MKPSDYRQQYASFCSARERARYRLHAGLSRDEGFEAARERAEELWTRSAVNDLARILEETPAQFETERASLGALVGAAQTGYVEASAREVSEELARCEASAQVEWNGQRISIGEATERLGEESDATRRRELGSRFTDAANACDDLRAAQLDARRDAARALGFADEIAFQESLTGTSFEQLAARAETFLRRTDAIYNTGLSRWAARNLPAFTGSARHFTDALFFRRMSHMDAPFTSRRLPDVHRETTGALGIRADAQRRIRIDDEARPLKNSRPACFGVDVPEEVYLVVHPQSAGASRARDFFEQAGAAQLFAWSSKDLASRYPEFIHAPDGATRTSYGLLFAYLFHDATWMSEHFRLKEREAQEARRAFALATLFDVRLEGARLRSLLATREAGDVRSESVAETRASFYTEATGFHYPSSLGLLDMSEARDAAERLRASLFAAALDEYLRGRHGRRWWTSRRAGDELVDLWNTSSRYGVEELARLVGVDGVDFEFLADKLIEALSDE